MAEVPREPTGQEPRLLDLVNCPKCGTSNPAGTRYCHSCGASMAGTRAGKPAPAAEKKGFFSRLFGKRA